MGEEWGLSQAILAGDECFFEGRSPGDGLRSFVVMRVPKDGVKRGLEFSGLGEEAAVGEVRRRLSVEGIPGWPPHGRWEEMSRRPRCGTRERLLHFGRRYTWLD